MNSDDRERILARFMRYVNKTDTCWLWTGATKRGRSVDAYGCFWWGGDKGTDMRAHRAAYELLVGPIPHGLTLDHLCRVTLCVNPAHLEAVTTRENIMRGTGPSAANARKTECLRGHPYTDENVVHVGTSRECRACTRMRAPRKNSGQRAAYRARMLGDPAFREQQRTKWEAANARKRAATLSRLDAAGGRG